MIDDDDRMIDADAAAAIHTDTDTDNIISLSHHSLKRLLPALSLVRLPHIIIVVIIYLDNLLVLRLRYILIPEKRWGMHRLVVLLLAQRQLQ